MKQKNYRKVIITFIGLAVSHVAMATDYSSMTTEELTQMRSQVRGMSVEEQNSFRNEMRSRVQSMSAEEKARFQQANRQGSGNRGSGYGSGYGSRQGGGRYQQ